MGLIKASLSDVSTEFTPINPGIYEFEIEDVEAVENGDKFSNFESDDEIAYIVKSKIESAADPDNESEVGRVMRDYVNIVNADKKSDGEGKISEIGLSQLKRYFEAAFGKEEVATWTDEDYDTEKLSGRRFRGQLKIDSYTPKGATEPRKNNKFSRIDSLD